MIVDCHTHIWQEPAQLGDGAEMYLARQSGSDDVAAGTGDHAAAASCVDKTLVLGFQSRHLHAEVPNDLICEYVAQHFDRTIGIAAIDPADDDAVKTAENLLDRKEFRGLTVSPAAQNFHPTDSRAMKLYELACDRKVPMIFEQGTHFPQHGCIEYARPALLDQIAREFPDLTIVISSMGLPWVAECIALLGKHPRVFSDIAGLARRPWQAYNTLVLAHQFNVMDKILFGSDFPFFTAAEAIETLYRLHEVAQGTNLPGVPRETLRSVIERNALSVLGIATPAERTSEVTGEQPEKI